MNDDATNSEVIGELQRSRKIEWGIILALVINVITAAFGVGVYFNTLTEHGRRIDQLEKSFVINQASVAQLNLTLIEIKGHVEYLRERAEEDRRVIYQKKGL